MGLYAFRGAGGLFRLAGTIVSCAAVQDAQPVVVGVGVAESLAFDLFDDEVDLALAAVGSKVMDAGFVLLGVGPHRQRHQRLEGGPEQRTVPGHGRAGRRAREESAFACA